MKIFIIGSTNTGKTTFAKKLFNHVGKDILFLESSEILKNFVNYPDNLTDENRTKKLTKFSLSILKNDHFAICDMIENIILLQNKKYTIVNGIRNPTDFIKLYNPKTDMVFISQEKGKSVFEKFGIKSIKSYLTFIEKNKFNKLKINRVQEFKNINIDNIIL